MSGQPQSDDGTGRALACRLAEVAPIVRGLLAEPTGDQDRPYGTVILESFADGDAADLASAHDRLDVELPEPGDPPARIRERIQGALSDYVDRNGSKPRVVRLSGLGALVVSSDAGGEPLPLHNKVALVTGAAGAIGYGVCQGLLENGCRVAATDLPGEKLERFAAELQGTAPGRVIGPPMDVTDPASVHDGFTSVINAWGGIDIVVVNAGIALVSRLAEMDLEAFRRLARVNMEGALLTLAEAQRQFVLQGTGGDIVIMSTKNVPAPGAGFGAYSATKAACHQLGRIASLEMAPYGIRVNMVAPDAVFAEGEHRSGLWEEVGPDRMRARGLDEEGLRDYYRNRNLLKAAVTGRHVANAVLFFVTRQTPTTGATIPVDGGLPEATPR